MSYILDALRKAESERNSGTGTTGDLHAGQPAYVPSADEETPERRKAWIHFGLSVVAALLLGLVWLKFWRSAAPTFSSPPVATAPAPEQQVPKVADPAPPAVTAPPASPPASPPAPPPSSSDTAPSGQATPKPVKPKASPAPAPKKPAKAAEPPAPKPAETKAAPPEERIAGLRELPPHIQNEIPALSINGYIYSANKADRTVLINNKLLREGDQVAPDLMLERLTPTGMVLNYKGYRYRTSY
jgi:general secretion pathway protein B